MVEDEMKKKKDFNQVQQSKKRKEKKNKARPIHPISRWLVIPSLRAGPLSYEGFIKGFDPWGSNTYARFYVRINIKYSKSER